MKKILLMIAILSAANAFAYKVEITNNTSYDVTVSPRFAAKIVKKGQEDKWALKAGETLKKETGAFCTQSLKIEAVVYAAKHGEVSAAVMPVTKAIEYKPKSTGLGMRCGDYKVLISTYPDNAGELQITANDPAEMKKQQ